MYQTGCVFVCTSADDNFNYRHLWKQSISLNQRKYIACLDLDLDSEQHVVRGLEITKQMLWLGPEQRTEVMLELYLNYFTGHYLSLQTIISTCFVSPFLICVVFMLLLDIVHLCNQYEYERWRGHQI